MTIDKSLSCSYKGVPFLWLSDSTKRGFKIVNHEYPNANHRYTEQLGKTPSILNVSCLVYGGSKEKNNFINALESEGVGVLTMPYEKDINVKAGTYSIRTDYKDMGKFFFNVVFRGIYIKIKTIVIQINENLII